MRDPHHASPEFQVGSCRAVDHGEARRLEKRIRFDREHPDRVHRQHSPAVFARGDRPAASATNAAVAIATHGCDAEVVGPLYDAVIRDTVARFEGTRLAAEALGV